MPRLIQPQVSKRRYRISSPPATLEPPLTPVVFPQGRVDLPRRSEGPELHCSSFSLKRRRDPRNDLAADVSSALRPVRFHTR